MKSKYQELFDLLTQNLEKFIEEVGKTKLGLMATDEWTVKDELCHIVFWHENYAANYQAMVEHKAPPLPEGMSTINQRGVSSLRKHRCDALIHRLVKANESLRSSIVDNEIPEMTYSKGGRIYKTDEFLVMITKHIESHTKQVRRAKDKRPLPH